MDKSSDMAEAFGAFVKAQRQLANISQRQLAKASGMSDSYLSQIERGQYRPSAEVLRGIAQALGMAPSALLPSSASWIRTTNSPPRSPSRKRFAWMRDSLRTKRTPCCTCIGR